MQQRNQRFLFLVFSGITLLAMLLLASLQQGKTDPASAVEIDIVSPFAATSTTDAVMLFQLTQTAEAYIPLQIQTELAGVERECSLSTAAMPRENVELIDHIETRLDLNEIQFEIVEIWINWHSPCPGELPGRDTRQEMMITLSGASSEYDAVDVFDIVMQSLAYEWTLNLRLMWRMTIQFDDATWETHDFSDLRLDYLQGTPVLDLFSDYNISNSFPVERFQRTQTTEANIISELETELVPARQAGCATATPAMPRDNVALREIIETRLDENLILYDRVEAWTRRGSPCVLQIPELDGVQEILIYLQSGITSREPVEVFDIVMQAVAYEWDVNMQFLTSMSIYRDNIIWHSDDFADLRLAYLQGTLSPNLYDIYNEVNEN